MLLCSNGILAQDETEETTPATEYKDHPLFNSMPNYHIIALEEKEFDAFPFPLENSADQEERKSKSVEGKFFDYYYALDEGKTEASPLQIFRNYENAITKAGGKIVSKWYEKNNSYSFIAGQLSHNKKNVWVYIEASGYEYRLVIVVEEVMVQVIKANEMLDALSRDGFISLNILFETGKATIQAESKPLVDQVYELLNTTPDLKVSIEGHTDNTGTVEGNKKLSEQRAKAVVDALITLGIKSDRLSSVGWGQERPVADNRTEDGRTKNRRVEIVKK
jgi:outer membrane protein OmpA-like peptidoglycan-associated protein